MPTSREIIGNRPLSGVELKEVLKADFAEMLDNDGMLSAYIGYGRFAYELEYKLHLDNPTYPEHKTTTKSRNPLENAPLDKPSPKAIVKASKRIRQVNSPNTVRLEQALPMTAVERDPSTGSHTEVKIKYPKQPREEGAVVDLDVSEEAKQGWKVK